MIHEIAEEPLFLKVKSRDTVLVGEYEIFKVISFFGGTRDQLAHLLEWQISIPAKLNVFMAKRLNK
tara:strand:- start:1686 stop:1883 length:198 start_codon:yes stop_codon:yes gene_type:complete